MCSKTDCGVVLGFVLFAALVNYLAAPSGVPGDVLLGMEHIVSYDELRPPSKKVNLHACAGPDGMVGHGYYVIKWAVEAWVAENNYELNIVESTHEQSETMQKTADYEIQYQGVGGKLRCKFPFHTFKIAVAGEVFEGNRPCQGATFILDRQFGRNHKGCPTVHYYQALSLPTTSGRDLTENLRLCSDDPPLVETPAGTIITVSEVYKKVYDHADAVVRSTVMGMLASRGIGGPYHLGHRLYHHLGDAGLNYTRAICAGRDMDSTKCKEGHLFDIEMENTSEPGYTSEKLVVGMMSGTIPIYWGDTDYATMDTIFNKDRYIRCEVDRKAVRNMTAEVVKLRNDGDQLKLHKWALEKIGPLVAPCVDKVEQVMKSKTLQRAMLGERGLKPWVCAQKMPNGYTAGNMSLYLEAPLPPTR
jgi:hypothetical protein